MGDVIRVRRDTAANWTAANPVLAAGEMGFETDTNSVKVGDGSTAWSSLSAIGGGGGGSVDAFMARLDADAGSITSSTLVDLVWDNTVINEGSNVSRSGAVLTFSNAGTYMMHADVTLRETSSSGRSHYQCEFQVDTGSGYSRLAGSLRGLYARLTGQIYTVSIQMVYAASAGDKLKVQAMLNGGVSPATFEGDSCAISAIKLS